MTTALLLLLAWTGAPQEDTRAAIQKSLPYLEKQGVAWMNERKCSSCHHVTFLVWTHREALGRGFAVDPGKLEEWTRWAVDFSLTAKTKEGKRNGGGLDTMAQVILARPAGADLAPYRELADLILGEQKPDGSWEAGGQLPVQRRPKPETNEASTMWILHSLQSLDSGRESWKPGREKAAAWLKDKKPGQSIESLAVRLLTSPTDALLQELLKLQNEDGGWGFIKGEPSDALATGQTLYVLSYSDRKAVAESIGRASSFLVRTQNDDGSWKVPSTKPKGKELSIPMYWGTAWAAIGMLRTLPE